MPVLRPTRILALTMPTCVPSSLEVWHVLNFITQRTTLSIFYTNTMLPLQRWSLHYNHCECVWGKCIVVIQCRISMSTPLQHPYIPIRVTLRWPSLVPRPSASRARIAYVTFEPYLTRVQRSHVQCARDWQTAWERG